MIYDELNEELKQLFDEWERQIEVAKKLEEFRKTRAIATAVEICDIFIKEMGFDE